MKTEPDTWSVSELRRTREIDKQLFVNHEYQRGDTAWSNTQQKMLIDSILRGFHLPVFYFHLKETKGKAGTNAYFDIVDGQQRMTAIEEFCNSEMRLLDPSAANSKFPAHLRDRPCPWANRTYETLEWEDKERFDEAQLSIAKVVDADENEVRDLFIRLNSGSALRPQERRDALPGKFCEFVNELGGRMHTTNEGKKRLKGGHALFIDLMKLKPISDQGATREFVSRLVILLYNYRRDGRFMEVKQSTIDDFYYEHLNWDENSRDALSLTKSFNDINSHLEGWLGPNLLKHEVIHSLFLWADLDGDYKSDWKTRYASCLAEFKRQLLEANKTRDLAQPDPMWTRYGSLTRASANRAQTLQRRHEYFRGWMMRELKPQPLAGSRVFPPDVKQQAWLGTEGVCAYSNQPELCQDTDRINFYEAEYHHIIPYSDGGSSTLENAAITHKACNQRIGAAHVPVINDDGTRRLGEKVDAS